MDTLLVTVYLIFLLSSPTLMILVLLNSTPQSWTALLGKKRAPANPQEMAIAGAQSPT